MDSGGERQDTGKEAHKAVRDVAGRFKRSASPRNAIDRAVRMLAPDDRPQTLVDLFDGRASYHTIRGWRRGQVGTPQWAIDLLRAKHDARGSLLAELVAGPGPRAGWNNLGAYRASRNSER